jgi:ubiquitin conjugation factor E4 B
MIRALEQGSKVLIPLLTGYSNNQRISSTLLSALIERFDGEQDQLTDIFEPICLGVVEFIKKQGLLGQFIIGLDTIQMLFGYLSIRKLLINGNGWKPNCQAKDIGDMTILGGILSVGIDIEELEPLFELLPNREQLYASQVESAFYAMRTAAGILHQRVHQLLYQFLKSGAEFKEALLDWLAWLAIENKNRLKMHVDPLTVSSDRLIFNTFVVLLKFCEPFMSPASSKLGLIDKEYYSRSTRLDVMEATKNHATLNEYKEYISSIIDEGEGDEKYSPNFITECFFMTVQYFRLGPVRLINEYMELLRNLREVQQALDYFESSSGTGNAMNERATRNAKNQMQRMKDGKLAMDVYLLDPSMMENSFTFISLMASWMTKLLPSSTDPIELSPRPFMMLPEFFVECVGEYSLFISRFNPQFWVNRPIEGLLNFMLMLLDRGDLVKNPYLRAKFVDFLYGFTDPHLETVFDLYPMVVQSIAFKLMKFYIEVESTGASSQFYDKFNIRYNISKIFKTIWQHPAHRVRMVACSRNVDLFTRFTNLLLNDVTFLLDESIGKLAEIHERQVEMSDSNWSAHPLQERQERENGLRTLERQCESYLMLATSTLEMLEYLTSEIVDPFLRLEIIDRLAAMLCYNLVQMVGPKAGNLKVRNPEKYHWEPRTVLSLLVGTFLNMGRKEAFLRSVASDTRSFSIEMFGKAALVLKKHGIRSTLDIDRFQRLTAKVMEYVTEGEQAEQREVPEEFLDPLMFTVMRDPVLLKTSNIVVDRSTIVAHMLNDPTDPFNRRPLTMDDVESDADLKAKIEAFLTKQ